MESFKEIQLEMPKEKQLDIPKEPQPICKQGEERPCFTGKQENKDKGNCKSGKQTCDNNQWGPCQGELLPGKETCNGEDDDCDGQTDEDFANKAKTCEAGVGECKQVGTNVCKVDGTGTECNAKAKIPAKEMCDGLDNDCDGQTDEGSDEECFTGKPEQKAVGPCAAGKYICKNGTLDKSNCVGEVLPVKETCDGKDEDCDGKVDNGLKCNCKVGETKACGATVGECKQGTQTCANGAWGACTGEVKGKKETCDGKDEDCDGQVDEELTQACFSGDPKHRGKGICEEGKQTCSNGTWGTCQGEVKPSTPQCNGKDNDCDGRLESCPFFQVMDGGIGSNDYIHRIVTDQAGNIYTIGSFQRQSLSWGGKTYTQQGRDDSFLTKLDPGGRIEWFLHISGKMKDYGSLLDIDSKGNLLVGGHSSSDELTIGSVKLKNTSGASNIYLAKVSSGGKVLWAHFVASKHITYIRGMQLDSKDNFWVVGNFSKEIILGTTTLTSTASVGMFLAKFDRSGKVLSAESIGQDDNISLQRLYLDKKDQIYLAGTFSTKALQIGAITLKKTSFQSNGYIFKLDASAKALWGVVIESAGINNVTDVVVNSKEEVVFGGHNFNQKVVLKHKSGSVNLPTKKGYSSYVVMLDSTGKYLRHTRLDGDKSDLVHALAINQKDQVYAVGQFTSDITIGASTITSKGSMDVGVIALDEKGAMLWAKYTGGSGYENCRTISATNDGFVLVGIESKSASVHFNGKNLSIQGGGAFGLFKLNK